MRVAARIHFVTFISFVVLAADSSSKWNEVGVREIVVQRRVATKPIPIVRPYENLNSEQQSRIELLRKQGKLDLRPA